MITLKIKKLEKILNKKIEKNIKVIGIDTATRTGLSIITTSDKIITISYSFIDIKGSAYFKYDSLIDRFKDIFREEFNKVVIEDTYLKFYGRFAQANSFKQLSRIGMIPYIFATLNGVNKYFINANSARTSIGLNGKAKKEVVHKEFKKKFGIKIDDSDAIDAVILAIGGIIND